MTHHCSRAWVRRGLNALVAVSLILALSGLAPVAPAVAASGIGGTVFSWGPNGYGTLCLGPNATEPRYATPQAIPIATIPAPRQVAVGNNYTLLLRDDGKVYACGNNNSYGQQGNGVGQDGANHPTATPVVALANITQVAAGANHSLALGQGGTVYSWGSNVYGELGINSADNGAHPTPVAVPGLTDIVAIAAGVSTSFAVEANGTVWAWGANGNNRLGTGIISLQLKVPAVVQSIPAVAAIAAGETYAAAITQAGAVYVWGYNGQGQLGNGGTDSLTYPPTLITPMGTSGNKDVASGYRHIVVLKNDGTVWAWGQDTDGQVGGGTAITTGCGCRPTPTQVVNLTSVKAIGTGTGHSLALKTDGTVWAWGNNSGGALGRGTVGGGPHPTPAQVVGINLNNAAGYDGMLSRGLFGSHSVAARRYETWNLSLGTNGAGAGTAVATPVPGGIEVGTSVALNATPQAGSAFAGWTVNGTFVGANPSLTLTLDGDKTVLATFVPQVGLTIVLSGPGQVARDPAGTSSGPTYGYAPGTLVTLTPQSQAGHTFVGWVVDNVYQGWPNPLTITLNGPHTVQATFAPTASFPDVGSGRADYTAITELASRGTIKGYQDGRYGPDDRVRRDQMAALIARAMPAGPGTPPTTLTPPACLVAGSWDCEVWGNNFSDGAGINPDLWRNAGTMQHYGVSIGYSGATCVAKRVPSPCFGPGDNVTYAQTISFITRAMKAKGYWADQPGAPLPYSNVPSAHQLDVRTFYFYTSALGGVPSAPTTLAGWDAGATRGWFARALWNALDSHWRVDRVP